MKAYRMLLEHHAAAGRGRDGRVAVDRPDSRWCSYIFEIGCDNGSPRTLRARRVRSPRDRPLAADHASRSPQSKGMAEMHAALDVERMAASCPGGSSLPAAHSVDPQSSWLHVSAVVDDP